MNIPSSLKREFRGGAQKDWIIYDDELTNLFCIAIWRKHGSDGWVLGEYVNITDHEAVEEVMSKGYMTMLEAARWRGDYQYEIARHAFDVDRSVVQSGYWKALVPKLKPDLEMASPNSPIVLREFLGEMRKLVRPGDIIWSNIESTNAAESRHEER